MSTLDIEDICTDQRLLNRAGSARVNRAQPVLAERTANRQTALDEVLLALSGRSPPILEADLADPTQLSDVVMYRALQMIFENSMASLEGLHAELAKVYGTEYTSAAKRSYTVNGSLRGPSGNSLRMERR